MFDDDADVSRVSRAGTPNIHCFNAMLVSLVASPLRRRPLVFRSSVPPTRIILRF